MDWNSRIEILKRWGTVLRHKNWSGIYDDIQRSNPWFTRQDIEMSLIGVCKYLDPLKLNQWSKAYTPNTSSTRTVGLILAGNIPLVGIHDFICLIAVGIRAKIKMSSQDSILLPFLFQELLNIEPRIRGLFTFVDGFSVGEIDAIIATGSDNTSRYIKFHYPGVPQIIRNNRTSIAVIRGDENSDQLLALGTDIFSHFGKGCRNVSKVWIPPDYDFSRLISSNRRFSEMLQHPKYKSNYTYQRALCNTQGKKIIDTGYSLFYQSQALVSPLSVVFYEVYTSRKQLAEAISRAGISVQCIASVDGWFDQSLPFGTLQKPDLWDYADNIDTMEFLLKL